MPNVSSFGAQTDNAVVSGTVTDRQMIIPEVPPQGLMSVGPRVTPNFVKPREWNAQTTYHFFDAVRDAAGNAYVATKPVVAAGTPLTDEDYWFLWADPDTRFDDLNETVKTFNQRITQNASAITAEVARATAAEATKAPTNHASEETVYGIGNEVNYGHVKLAVDDTPMTSDANAGIAATPKNVHDATVKNVVIFGDSWAANAPGIGIGQKIFDALTGPKNLVGNFAVAGAQFGNAENATGLHTASQLDVSKSKLSEEQRSKITHVIMVAGVNNVGAKIPTVNLVNKCWTDFKTAFPNAQMYWLYSSMRCIYNETTQGNAPRVQYDTFTSGARMAGVTVFENSLVWLKTTNEASFWDEAADNARHPNSAGIATFAKIGAAAIESGYDPQFITTVPIQLEEDFQGGNNYADAYMIGTMVHIHMVLVSDNFKSSKVKIAKIPKLCWVTPQSYTQAPCTFNDQTKVGYAIMDGVGNISIMADEKPASFAVVDMTYRIM